MLDKFFGIHPAVVRNGTWAKLRPGAKDLYVYLMQESERCCTRELRRTDGQIRELIGAAGRTLCDARKKLQEYGLIQCTLTDGNKYQYAICNPETRLPYVGDPRQPLTCAKRGKGITKPNESLGPSRVELEPQKVAVRGVELKW